MASCMFCGHVQARDGAATYVCTRFPGPHPAVEAFDGCGEFREMTEVELLTMLREFHKPKGMTRKESIAWIFKCTSVDALREEVARLRGE